MRKSAHLLLTISVFGLLLWHNDIFGFRFLLGTPGTFTGEFWIRLAGQSIFDKVLPLSLTGMVGLAAWGIGLLVYAGLALPVLRPIDSITAFGLGFGLFAMGVFVIGLSGLLYPWILATYLFLTCLISCFFLIPRYSQKFNLPHGFIEQSVWKALAVGVVLYALWHGLIIALAPAVSSDVVAYHLAIPKLYLKAHHVIPIPSLIHSYWPHLMAMFYSLPIALRADTAAALVHWLLTTALLAGVYYVGRDEFNDTAAWMAILFLVCRWTYLAESGLAHADGAFAFFSFLSMYALWTGLKEELPKKVFLAGLLTGLAASVKLLGAPLLGLSALWIVWKTRTPKKKFNNAVLFAAGGFSMVGPWYIKTWVEAGNPFWPFLSSLFGGRWGAEYVNSVILPMSHPAWFSYWRQWDYLAAHLYQPLVLLTLIALFWKSEWPAIAGFWLFPIIPYSLFLHPEAAYYRYLWPLIAQISLWEAWVVNRILRSRKFAKLLLIPLLLYMASPILETNENDALVAASDHLFRFGPFSSARDYYIGRSYTGNCRAVMQAMDPLLKNTDRVLFLGEHHGYFTDHSYQWGDPLTQGLLAYSQFADAAIFAQQLKRQGITHLLIEDFILSGGDLDFDAHTLKLIQGVIQTYGKEVLAQRGHHLYVL
jgi:hypothetical protein